MDTDDWLMPAKKKDVITLPRLLEPLSIADLKEYIVTLETEAHRVREEMTRKEDAARTAQTFFKNSAP